MNYLARNITRLYECLPILFFYQGFAFSKKQTPRSRASLAKEEVPCFGKAIYALVEKKSLIRKF